MDFHFPVHHPAGRCAEISDDVQPDFGRHQYCTGLAVYLSFRLGGEGSRPGYISQHCCRGNGGYDLSDVLCSSSAVLPIKWSAKSLRLFIRNIGYQCHIGSSALLAKATLATLMFMGNQIFMEYSGEDGVGAFGIACYYIPFVFMAGNAIAQSAQPIISYNFSLGHRMRVRHTGKITLLASFLCGIIITFLFTFCPHILVGLFVHTDSAAARVAITGFIFFILNLSVIGYYQSVERIKPATFFALLRGFIFLIPCFILLPEVAGTNGIWLALSLSELLTTSAIVVFYIICHCSELIPFRSRLKC